MFNRILQSLFIAIVLALSSGQVNIQRAYADPPAWSTVPQVAFFHDALLPYGKWLWDTSYGWVWSPSNMPAGWRPYTDGRWVFTVDGWMWVSEQLWGWAAFHYGRWFQDEARGWLWYPDVVWAPSWVAWRVNDELIGWAPLPPEAVWNWRAGVSFGDMDQNKFLPPHSYSYCHIKDFADPHVGTVLLETGRNDMMFQSTTFIGNTIKIENRHIVASLPFEAQIDKVTGQPAYPLQVVRVESPFEKGVKGDVRAVFRPEKSPPVVQARFGIRESSFVRDEQLAALGESSPQTRSEPEPEPEIEIIRGTGTPGHLWVNYPTRFFQPVAGGSGPSTSSGPIGFGMPGMQGRLGHSRMAGY